MAAKPLKRATLRQHDFATVLYELELHRIELAMQNEELRSTQSEMASSLERYRELYEHAPVGYLTLDRSGKIQEANQRACAMVGVESPNLLGRHIASFLQADDADKMSLHLRDVFAKGVARACEVVLRSEVGPVISVHVDTVPFPREETPPRSCRLVLIDLSALQRAEDGLRASETKNRVLLDTAADAIVIGDAKGRIESLNRAAERMFGYTREELLGQNVRILVPRSLRRQHDRFIERHVYMRTSGIVSSPPRELTGVRKGGAPFPIEVSIGDWWHDGRRKFTAIISDITARKQRETQLRESETRFQTIAEHVTTVFLFHDRALQRFSYVSPSFEAIFGRPTSELSETTSRCFELIHPDDRARVAEAYASLWSGARPDEVFRIQRPDGALRWVRTRVFPVADHDGTVRSDVCVVEDVTQAKELEEKLVQVQKMEALGTLSSSVAHDFNNVLQAILGCLNIARSEGTSPEKARSYLDRAAQAALRGGELASQLMGFARRRDTAPRRLRIDTLLMDTKCLLERLVTEGIVLDVRAEANDSCVLADPVQLEQILLNLAANARDAMPGGGTLSIRTKAIELDGEQATLERGRYVRLIVEDTGAGMDDLTRVHIFEPFFTTKLPGKGTGLGLSTVFATCKELGGHIEVASKVGKGTRFTLYFPMVASGTHQPVPVAPVIHLFGRVLLVEDEPLVRTVTRHHLEEIGLEVFEAGDATEAVGICTRQRGALDVLVSDVVLPLMSGPRLAAVLKHRYPELAVLFVTANPDLMNVDEAELERVAVLRKPFGKEELASSLAKLLIRE